MPLNDFGLTTAILPRWLSFFLVQSTLIWYKNNRKIMEYTLFLDDERMPPDGMEGSIVIVRSVAEARHMIVMLGIPTFISFDHDLGENQPTGYDFAKWLVDFDLVNNGGVFRRRLVKGNFGYYVHSQNPVGKANIEGLLDPYLKLANEKARAQ